MKRNILCIVMAFIAISLQAQGVKVGADKIPHLRPQEVYAMPSDKIMAEYDALMTKAAQENGDGLTDAEYQRMEEIEEDPILEDLYSGKCSWYCGGSVDSVTASSHLKAQGKSNYLPMNAHNFDHESVWSEGVPGQGIGEWLDYEFAGGCPRVTAIKILAGHVKTAAAWKANSRPKSLKVYYLGKPLCIFELKDFRGLQYFDLGDLAPLGFNDADKPSWHLRFEIIDVYPGTKYQDTVISELYFDGIDVH